MKNKEAINILKRGYPNINRYAASESEVYEYDVETYNEAVEYVIKALEEKIWIPVSEKLPKYNKTVLISVKQIGKEARVFTAQRRKRFKTPDIFECCTDNDGWWDFRISAWDDHEVLAWMPLPEPYKKGDKE